jgi:hypothetical protein
MILFFGKNSYENKIQYKIGGFRRENERNLGSPTSPENDIKN